MFFSLPLIVICILSLLFLLTTSSFVVNKIMKVIYNKNIDEIVDEDEDTKETESEIKKRLSTGFIIGKCENIIIFIFILTQAYTALAIIFTAKTIIRKEDIQKNSMYFLAGTMINVTYSIVIGIITYVILKIFINNNLNFF